MIEKGMFGADLHGCDAAQCEQLFSGAASE